jgi:hypothetical protein
MFLEHSEGRGRLENQTRIKLLYQVADTESSRQQEGNANAEYQKCLFPARSGRRALQVIDSEGGQASDGKQPNGAGPGKIENRHAGDEI